MSVTNKTWKDFNGKTQKEILLQSYQDSRKNRMVREHAEKLAKEGLNSMVFVRFSISDEDSSYWVDDSEKLRVYIKN